MRLARSIWVAGAALVAGVVLVVVVISVAAAAPAPASCPNAGLSGFSPGLPDCRAYEQVSPVEKGGYNAVDWQVIERSQAAADGERVFYQGRSAFPGAEGNTNTTAGHLSVRTASGWRTVELTPHSATLGPESEGLAYYEPVSSGLDRILVKAPDILTVGANQFAYNLYVRDLENEASWGGQEYMWVNDIPLPEPTTQACNGLPTDASCVGAIALAGASVDLAHVLFESRVKLVGQAPVSGVEALYENAGGTVRLVGVLPDGQVAVDGSTAGGGVVMAGLGSRRVEHAISAGGERVVFEADSDGHESNEKGQSGLTEVYDRIGNAMADPSTIDLSAPTAGASPKVSTAEPATFWDASVDGSRVFFTSKAELMTASNTGSANNSEDLYEYNLETKGLRDLSVDTNAADVVSGAGVLGVIGVSEDGEYVYFVADGQLVAGKGVDGKPNLYMEHDGGKPIFIATLKPGNTTSQETEKHEPGDSLDWTQYQEVQRAYVTPDGHSLGFMSAEKVPASNFSSGYENKGDSEVFEYTAPTAEEEIKGGTGSVVCVSCDPSGAAPSGSAYIAGAGAESNGYTPNGASSPFHRIRALSDSGMRVFFVAPPYADEMAANSEETRALKVYEYEQDGEGSCGARGGCIYLLSGVSNPTNDLFLDASDEGENVFFATYSRLASSDTDSLIDVYDARVDGGFPLSEPVVECQNECHSGSSVPSGPPLESGVSGPSGNVTSTTTVTKTVTKPSPKKLSCAAKAKKLKREAQRKRALGECAKARSKRKKSVRGTSGRKGR